MADAPDKPKTFPERVDAIVKNRISLDHTLPSPADLAYIVEIAFRYGSPIKAGLAAPKTMKALLGGVLGLYARREGASKTGRPTYRVECAHGALILGENDEVPEGRLLITDLSDADLLNEGAHAIVDEIERPALEV